MSHSTAIINVDGMSCNHCVKTITNALHNSGDVSDVNIDLAAKSVAVSFNSSNVSLEQINSTIETLGFDLI